jgi:hypothetical protein
MIVVDLVVVHDEVDELSVQAPYHQMKHTLKHSFIGPLIHARHHPGRLGSCHQEGFTYQRRISLTCHKRGIKLWHPE